MNSSDKRKIFDFCERTLKSFETWKKHCSTMEKLIKQIRGSKKAHLDLFTTESEMQKNSLSTLELHFLEKEEALYLELKILLDIQGEFDSFKEILQGNCNKALYASGDEPDEHLFKFLNLLTGLCADLKMISSIKALPLNQSILLDLNTFSSLVETNEATYPIEIHFENLMSTWDELIKDCLKKKKRDPSS